MAKKLSLGQAESLVTKLVGSADWSDLNARMLEEHFIMSLEDIGIRFTAFLREISDRATGPPPTLQIPESFNAAGILGPGYFVEKESDSELPPLVDMGKIFVRDDPTQGILLGGRVFEALYTNYEEHMQQGNPERSVLEWLLRNRGIHRLCFFGGVVRFELGARVIPILDCLTFQTRGLWRVVIGFETCSEAIALAMPRDL